MYVETHIQRVSEDPEAFVRMMQYAEQEHGCVFECNGDLSHYLYRGFANDKGYMPLIFSRVGHMHMRMARQHGDLSGAPPDPTASVSGRKLSRVGVRSMLSRRCGPARGLGRQGRDVRSL